MDKPTPVPGRYDHCGRWCTHCEEVGPFRRPAKSCDPWRCVKCGAHERDTDAPAPAPEPNLAVSAVLELAIARAEAVVGGNGHAEQPTVPVNCYDCGETIGSGDPRRLYRCEDVDACVERKIGADAPTPPPSNGSAEESECPSHGVGFCAMDCAARDYAAPTAEPAAPTTRPELCAGCWESLQNQAAECKLHNSCTDLQAAYDAGHAAALAATTPKTPAPADRVMIDPADQAPSAARPSGGDSGTLRGEATRPELRERAYAEARRAGVLTLAGQVRYADGAEFGYAARDASAQAEMAALRAAYTDTLAERDALQSQLTQACRELDRERDLRAQAQADADALRHRLELSDSARGDLRAALKSDPRWSPTARAAVEISEAAVAAERQAREAAQSRVNELERELDADEQRAAETLRTVRARAEAAEKRVAELQRKVDGYETGEPEPAVVKGALDAQADAETEMFALRRRVKRLDSLCEDWKRKALDANREAWNALKMVKAAREALKLGGDDA